MDAEFPGPQSHVGRRRLPLATAAATHCLALFTGSSAGGWPRAPPTRFVMPSPACPAATLTRADRRGRHASPWARVGGVGERSGEMPGADAAIRLAGALGDFWLLAGPDELVALVGLLGLDSSNVP